MAQITVQNSIILSMHSGFACPARKYFCNACKKYKHFTSLCFSKQKSCTKSSAYQITAEEIENESESEMDEYSNSYDRFILYQIKEMINQAKSMIPKDTSDCQSSLSYQIIPRPSPEFESFVGHMCSRNH